MIIRCANMMQRIIFIATARESMATAALKASCLNRKPRGIERSEGMDHMQKLEDVKVAIDRVFHDTSVDPEITRGSLEELKEQIHTLINALDD